MKKYWVLFFITALLIGTTCFFGKNIVNSIKCVDVLHLEPTYAESFITCNGKVEYSNVQNIYLTEPSKIKELCVTVGDRIKKDDIVAYVEKSPEYIQNFSEKDLKDLDMNSDNLKTVYSNFLKNKTSPDLKDKSKNTPLQVMAIKSPFDGWISGVNIEKDNFFDTQAPAVSVSDSGMFQLRLNLDETRAADVAVGQEVIINCAGVKNKEYRGKIKNISKEAKQNFGTLGSSSMVEVLASIKTLEDETELKSGFTAKCKVITEQKENTLVLPYDSVIADNDGKEYIYKYDKGLAKKSYITTGKEYESGFEILSGAEVDDKIILRPNLIKDGAHIKIKRV